MNVAVMPLMETVAVPSKLAISGLKVLYSILTRDIERTNNVLEQRRTLAADLRDNALRWAQLLLDTFDDAVRLAEEEGREAALAAVDELIADFMEIDYRALDESSPILEYLDEDKRFSEFVYSCRQFYQSALHIKRLVHGGIQDHDEAYISMQDTDIQQVVQTYKNEVELMVNRVTSTHNALKTIEIK